MVSSLEETFEKKCNNKHIVCLALPVKRKDCLKLIFERKKSDPLRKKGFDHRIFFLLRLRKFYRKHFRFSDSSIIALLKKAEAGTPMPELCREHGMGSTLFYR